MKTNKKFHLCLKQRTKMLLSTVSTNQPIRASILIFNKILNSMCQHYSACKSKLRKIKERWFIALVFPEDIIKTWGQTFNSPNFLLWKALIHSHDKIIQRFVNKVLWIHKFLWKIRVSRNLLLIFCILIIK